MRFIEIGTCPTHLSVFNDCTFDSLVTDPPAGIGFMGKKWDKDKGGRDAWIEDMAATYRECLRVLKPGAHGLVWALPRTSHWTATALENAGFEIRDVVHHLFGTGFPKSLDVSKAIDKTAGAKRKTWEVPRRGGGGGRTGHVQQIDPRRKSGVGVASAPATDAAKQWDGWGTALKPAAEHWILIRKPLIGTVAANVLEHGTGGINVDGCRVPGAFQSGWSRSGARASQNVSMSNPNTERAPRPDNPFGRWPPHVVLDDEAAAMLGDSAKFFPRFRYQAKPSTKEKSAGLEHLPTLTGGDATGRKDGSDGTKSPRAGAGRTGNARNPHPTVKPIELMRWLCRLITPPGGHILDPFAGSGTTGCAAVLEGFRFTGIEQNPEYAEVARARISYWEKAARGGRP